MATLIEMNERAFQIKIAQCLQKMTAGLGDIEQLAPMYLRHIMAATPSFLQYVPPPRVEYGLSKVVDFNSTQRQSSVAQLETVRCSSFFTRQEKEKKAIKQSFQWKLQQTSNELAKTKINETYDIAVCEM